MNKTSGTVHPRLAPIQRRKQIIDVASHEIARNGYWGFSVRRVADECGLTEPAVIYHFKNKVGLLVAVLEHRDSEDIKSFANSLGVAVEDVRNGGVEFGLSDFCSALMRRNAEQPEIIRLYAVLQGESLNPHHPAHSYFQNREYRVIATLAEAAMRDRVADPIHEARAVLSMMDGIQLRWLRDPNGFDLLEEWDQFARARWSRAI